MKVAKFGGSSLADAKQFKKVKEILLMDPDRHYVVPSAPGKRFKEDEKVTDLLYKCYQAAEAGERVSPILNTSFAAKQPASCPICMTIFNFLRNRLS